MTREQGWPSPDAVVFRAGERIGDYSVVGASKRGGMGQVFAAVHVPSGRKAAIKTVITTDNASLAYFEREISTLASLNHPAIVPIHDHGVFDARPWYAMDWLEGPTLRSLLQARWEGRAAAPTQATVRADTPSDTVPSPPASDTFVQQLDRTGLLSLCVQVLHALDYLHSRGIVHGDLKPENIFVLPGPRPMLVDFGISHWFAASRESLRLVPRAIGSAPYMAPEQIMGALIDARADLYAVGCLLYECLTGTNPFQRATAEATMLAHLNHDLDPASLHAPNVPGALDSTILRLLSKSPADRPRYASEVLASLEAQGLGAAGAEERRSSTPGPLYRAALLGREREVSVLRECLAQAAGGTSTKVLVRGEAGIGKTRIMLEALDLGFRSGMRVFCVRCDDGEARTGHDALAPLRPVFDAVSCGFAGVANWNEGEPRDAWVERLVGLLLAACSERPLLLAVDDVDRADELTLTVLQRLALTPTSTQSPLMLICTESLGRPTGLLGFRTLVVEPLSRAQVELAVCSMLATDYASPHLVDVVYERCDGNPLMLGQLLHVLLDKRLLVHSRDSGWHLESSLRLEHSLEILPHDQHEFLRLRLRSLSPQQRDLACAAAVLGRTFQLALLSGVCVLEQAGVRAVLSQLVSLDIVEATASDWYRFAHAQLRDLLYEMIPPEAATTLHERAATVMASLWDTSSAASLMARAWHLERCGRHAEAAHNYENAGKIFGQNQFFQRAVDALTLAKQEHILCMASPAQLLRVGEALGDATLLVRQLAAAEHEYAAALVFAAGDAVVTARLHRKLAACSQHDHDKAAALLHAAIASFDGPREEDEPLLFEWLQANLDLMFVYYWKRDPARVLEIGRALEAPLSRHGTDEQRASYSFNMAAGVMALHRYVTGPYELALAEEALQYYTRKNDRQKMAMTSFLRAMILLCSDELESAAAGFESLVAIGKKTSSFTIQVRALAYLCLVHRKRRDIEKLRRVASATLGLAKEHDMPEYQGIALGNLAWLAHIENDPGECERLAREALGCWSAAGTKTAFSWTAILPLAATLAQHGRASAEETRVVSAKLLEDSQQQLPESLARALREVVNNHSRPVSELMPIATQVAKSLRFM